MGGGHILGRTGSTLDGYMRLLEYLHLLLRFVSIVNDDFVVQLVSWEDASDAGINLGSFRSGLMG